MPVIKSRIHKFFSKELMLELDKICNDKFISDNNKKVDLMCAVLDKYDVNYTELGPGTNRFAILIDGYVFKIALDKKAKKDNLMEFSMSRELLPFVTKVYETNGLIMVAEYVTVISKEEFLQNKEKIRGILSILAEGYLLGDVGSITKNYMNWGYRDDGELVILDFAFIYRVIGNEMRCHGKNKAGEECHEFLNYDENYDMLVCPHCGKKYSFMDIRRRIDLKIEEQEIINSKRIAYQLKGPKLVIHDDNSEEDYFEEPKRRNTLIIF